MIENIPMIMSLEGKTSLQEVWWFRIMETSLERAGELDFLPGWHRAAQISVWFRCQRDLLEVIVILQSTFTTMMMIHVGNILYFTPDSQFHIPRSLATINPVEPMTDARSFSVPFSHVVCPQTKHSCHVEVVLLVSLCYLFL